MEKALSPKPVVLSTQADANTAFLQDKGGSALNNNQFQKTVCLVRAICIETASPGDLEAVKRASQAAKETGGDVRQREVLEALLRSNNKDYTARRVTTAQELLNFTLKSEDSAELGNIWMAYEIPSNQTLELSSGRTELSLDFGVEPDSGIAIRPEDLQKLVKIDAVNNGGVIDLWGVVLVTPNSSANEQPKIEEPKLVNEVPSSIEQPVEAFNFTADWARKGSIS